MGESLERLRFAKPTRPARVSPQGNAAPDDRKESARASSRAVDGGCRMGRVCQSPLRPKFFKSRRSAFFCQRMAGRCAETPVERTLVAFQNSGSLHSKAGFLEYP